MKEQTRVILVLDFVSLSLRAKQNWNCIVLQQKCSFFAFSTFATNPSAKCAPHCGRSRKIIIIIYYEQLNTSWTKKREHTQRSRKKRERGINYYRSILCNLICLNLFDFDSAPKSSISAHLQLTHRCFVQRLFCQICSNIKNMLSQCDNTRILHSGKICEEKKAWGNKG